MATGRSCEANAGARARGSCCTVKEIVCRTTGGCSSGLTPLDCTCACFGALLRLQQRAQRTCWRRLQCFLTAQTANCTFDLCNYVSYRSAACLDMWIALCVAISQHGTLCRPEFMICLYTRNYACPFESDVLSSMPSSVPFGWSSRLSTCLPFDGTPP